ncbi:putative anti-sigma-YlaC factor YlaD [Asanoa ferruginea]|uniref:Putative anti-sigma-YlaC factor YlaD n=1 Tax=Asanoa ferruginea TaxID=53367 RepID=A0A3D9ZBT8_9ACTN|nr:zf-HC2 domain-containing protein [Asanoa ferruginea]REF94755.1 putative anti-sigma-YlaC factor YlaD [Asanoa ferruginea]GIF45669.1 membrane protein [Asanoa ferruginea]
MSSTTPTWEIAGNQSPHGDDYLTMMCEHVRVALSARLDGEDPPTPAAEIDAHTATCADCRAWLAQAQRLDLVVRATPASPAPDLTVRVLTAVGADQRRREGEPDGRRQVLRIAVGVLAIAQLISAVPVLLGPEGALGAHATREMACFDIALAVGFALAALRPERARALVPVAFVLALCLAVTSAIDVLNAQTAVLHEIGHLAAVAQAAALWALGRGQQRTAPLAPATAAGRG